MAGGTAPSSSSVYSNTSSVYSGGMASPYNYSSAPTPGLTAPTSDNPFGTFNPYAWQNTSAPSNLSQQMGAYGSQVTNQMKAAKQSQLDLAKKSEADYNARKAAADSEWKAKYDALKAEFDTYKSQNYGSSGDGGGWYNGAAGGEVDGIRGFRRPK